MQQSHPVGRQSHPTQRATALSRWGFWRSQIDAAGMVGWLRARHPTKTAAGVAADLGISHETVAKWLTEDSLPNARMLVRMVCVYGPDFLAALITDPPDWLRRETCLEAQARLEATLAEVQGELMRQRQMLSEMGGER